MGLLDGILSAALGGSHASSTPAPGGGNSDSLMQIATQLLQQHGGVAGLINSFNQAGLGQVVSSWVSTGQNQAISPSQVSQVLGSGQIPAGDHSTQGDLLTAALGMLKSKL